MEFLGPLFINSFSISNENMQVGKWQKLCVLSQIIWRLAFTVFISEVLYSALYFMAWIKVVINIPLMTPKQ